MNRQLRTPTNPSTFAVIEKAAPVIAVIEICREDNPADVDEAYGKGTHARLLSDADDEADESFREGGQFGMGA